MSARRWGQTPLGIKNLGFLQAAYLPAQANPSLVPSYAPPAKFKESMEDMERKRVLFSLVERFGKSVSDSALADSDGALHGALEFYHNVKAAARRRVSGAESVYNQLKPYFKRPRSGAAEDKPADRRLERDLRGLLSGGKEGRI